MMRYRSSLHSYQSSDFWPSYEPWTLKFGQIFSCHHLFSLCLEILTWFLVYECIMMSYRSSYFVPVQWFLALELWNLAKYLDVTILFHWFEILTWFLVWECMVISYRSTLKFIPVEWFLSNLQQLGFEIWPNI